MLFTTDFLQMLETTLIVIVNVIIIIAEVIRSQNSMAVILRMAEL